MAELRLQLNPNAMVSGADRAETALEGVKREAREVESAIDRMSDEAVRDLNRVGGAASRTLNGNVVPLRTGVARMGQAFSAARAPIQQASFQVADFAAQVSAGGSAVVAFSQQGSQLLGFFGPFGALAGAALAVGLPLAAMFFSSADGAISYKDALKQVNDELADLKDRIAIAGGDFGSVAEIRATEQLLELKREQQRLESTIANAHEVVARSVEGDLADNLEKQAALEAQLVELRAARQELEKITDETGSATSGILAMRDAASETANQLMRALGALNSMQTAGIGALRESEIRLANRGDPVATAGALAQERISQAQAPLRQGATASEIAYLDGLAAAYVRNAEAAARNSEELSAWTRAQTNAGGAARSSSADISRAASAYDSLISSLDPLTAASMEYAKAQQIIAEALRAGHIENTEAARAAALASEQYREALALAKEQTSAWADLREVGGSAIERLLTGTANLRDTLKSVIVEMVTLIAKQNLLKGGIGSAGDGLGSLIIQGLFGGFFDTGGLISPGSFGVVGENGPEVVQSTARGALVTSRADTARMSRGGSGNVSISIDARGAQKGVAEQIDAKMRSLLPQIVSASQQATKDNWGNYTQQFNQNGAVT